MTHHRPVTDCCIDVHAHFVPPDLPDFASRLGDPRWPVFEAPSEAAKGGRLLQNGSVYRVLDEHYHTLDARLDWMSRYGVTRQVVSPLPALLTYWAEPADGEAFARELNESIARYVARDPERLIGFGTVPLQDPDRAIAVMRDIRKAGLHGIEIGSHAGPIEFDDPSMRPFFAAAAELDMPILLHPLEAEGLGRVSNPTVRFGVGVPADTGLTGAFLLLSRLMVDFPSLKICLCHGGGSFFWALPRIRTLLARRHDPETLDQLMRGITSVFVDTASLDGSNLRYLFEHLDTSRVVVGSDYPATAGESPVALLDEFTDEVRTALAQHNAERFLGISGH